MHITASTIAADAVTRASDFGAKHSPVDEFFGEQIEVEKEEASPRPLRFTWRGEVHDVAEVLNERVDAGFGGLPRRSRKWYTRRHRRYYVVKDAKGDIFEIYLDYGNRQKQSWWLVRKSDKKAWGKEKTLLSEVRS